MMKFAILGYDTINIGDDIQSLCVTFLLPQIDYIILRDNYDIVYDYKTGKKTSITEHCILIMNGWFMLDPHKKYTIHGIKFPINNPFIKPLFISTCLSVDVKELFSEKCLQYYKSYQPIYARDQSTVSCLMKRGINAIFCGCLTQTLSIDNIPLPKIIYDIIFVDVDKTTISKILATQPKNIKYTTTNHYIKQLAIMTPMERFKKAMEMLSLYRGSKKIYTTRLHCYLPSKAMGKDVIFLGKPNYRTTDLIAGNSKVEKEKLIHLFKTLISTV
jgi:hypothetical protein